MSHWLKWVTPNQLTIGRILIIPVLLVMIYLGGPLWNWVSFGIFFVACLTDYWDGYLARFRGQVSPMGKLLDPIADKMLISACLVLLVHVGNAPLIPTVAIIMREFAVSGLRQVAAAEGVVMAAVPGAKIKTILQMLAVGFLMLWDVPFGSWYLLTGQALLWVAMAMTLWSGFAYFREYFKSV